MSNQTINQMIQAIDSQDSGLKISNDKLKAELENQKIGEFIIKFRKILIDIRASQTSSAEKLNRLEIIDKVAGDEFAKIAKQDPDGYKAHEDKIHDLGKEYDTILLNLRNERYDERSANLNRRAQEIMNDKEIDQATKRATLENLLAAQNNVKGEKELENTIFGFDAETKRSINQSGSLAEKLAAAHNHANFLKVKPQVDALEEELNGLTPTGKNIKRIDEINNELKELRKIHSYAANSVGILARNMADESREPFHTIKGFNWRDRVDFRAMGHGISNAWAGEPKLRKSIYLTIAIAVVAVGVIMFKFSKRAKDAETKLNQQIVTVDDQDRTIKDLLKLIDDLKDENGALLSDKELLKDSLNTTNTSNAYLQSLAKRLNQEINRLYARINELRFSNIDPADVRAMEEQLKNLILQLEGSFNTIEEQAKEGKGLLYKNAGGNLPKKKKGTSDQWLRRDQGKETP